MHTDVTAGKTFLTFSSIALGRVVATGWIVLMLLRLSHGSFEISSELRSSANCPGLTLMQLGLY